MKKKSKRLIALLLTLTMVLSISVTSVFAYSSDTYSKYAPDKIMDAEDNYLSGATAAANTTAMSFLGINVTSTDAAGALNASRDADAPLNLLVFGSELNENPDPYFWNLYYNINKYGYAGDYYDPTACADWEGDYTLLNNAKEGPSGVAKDDADDVEKIRLDITVNDVTKEDCNMLFFYEPNILMGGTEDAYDVGLAYYQDSENGNKNYDPLRLGGWNMTEADELENCGYALNDGTVKSTFAMANGVYQMSVEIQDYVDKLNEEICEEAEEDKQPALISGRYGNVRQCGADYSNFALGIYYYVQSRLNPISSLISPIQKATYCTGISITDTGVITVTNDDEKKLFGDEDDKSSNGVTRYLQYLDGIADYVEADPDKTYSDYGALKQDVDLIIMDTSRLTNSQKILLNQVNIKVVDIEKVMPDTVYGTTMQSADNILGLPFFVGLLYEGDLSSYSTKLSEYDYTAYFVKNLYHVNNEDVNTVLAEMFQNGGGNVLKTYSAKNLNGSYEYYINSMIEIGAWYYTETELGSGNWLAVDDGLFVVSGVN